MSAIVALDAGTTGVRAFAIDERGRPRAWAYREFPQHFPQPGWVEHDPDEIWAATVATLADVGAALAGAGGVIGGPIMSAYPGLDGDMLPLALIVVILGGVGSLIGAFVGSFITGFVYTFGVALFPQLAYVILFLPMIVVIVFRPRGLFGKFAA